MAAQQQQQSIFAAAIARFMAHVLVVVRPLGSSWNKGRTLYCASGLCLRLFFYAILQVLLASLSSSSTDLLQVFTGLPTFLLPCRFHSRTCLVVSDVGFCSVWLTQVHLRLAISAGIHSCSGFAQSSLCLIFPGQYIFRIFLRHWLMKASSLFDMDLVTLQVSELCRRTDLT